MSFRTIRWLGSAVEILDQTLLPQEERYITLKDPNDVFEAIKKLRIRGAPAIGVAAAMGIALGAKQINYSDDKDFAAKLTGVAELLASSRPTAKNLFWAVDRMMAAAKKTGENPDEITAELEREALKIYHEDIEINRKMGQNGASLLTSGETVMTHCNAGALATAGYGTALSVVRRAVEEGKDIKVIATETRPLLQGSRLTVWELTADNIDVTLITDNMCGYVMREKKIDKVIVGADRIAANGDVANKIGTYTLAVVALENDVPFFVAAPISTIDIDTKSGEDIPIEERDPDEVREFMGKASTLKGVKVFNPAFDVTPNHLVSGIITERGILYPPYDVSISGIVKEV
ncbi:MAG: S-methyl-5-thioribose-1-phosphate isomerase [Deltaproteobacteria bacterium]|uniref:Methylthioribose-1-phosphate isomerase n=1 Tax=Candidatus Zymogenus saltonus TaxID=2844893 RepID=A0A9D8KG40_9DELT|nr:S-methyl-5-thioribose-1-phosphate isomerase [Candidatus Zymogenus saltonus]